MDGSKAVMTVAFLLCAFTGKAAEGQNVLDMCSSCHADATCDDKADGSGKVCNCKYGFVGNGRTFCQDKDECQIGANKICGQHTTCHNTYGSYFCTCLAGYSPSNNMAVFIPNDGTHCQDLDECRVSGVCGPGAHCRNLDGSFQCSCQVGYQVQDGVQPFHPLRDTASCRVVDCGRPVPAANAVLQTLTGTTFGSEARFVCDGGFVWRRGDNGSVCAADGLWRGPTMVCEAECGPTPVLAHSEVLWLNRSVVIHGCVEGYYRWTGSDVSVCSSSGVWQEATLICKAECGPTPVLAHSEVLWLNRSVVIHGCVEGYHSWRGSDVSRCGSSGLWQEATLKCIEVKPPITHLSIFNEKCLRWKAEKYEEDTETYKVLYTGTRDYQRSFHDRRQKYLSSKDDRPEFCLSLLPATNYSISITATSTRFTATISTSTSLSVPPAPVVYYSEFETPLPALSLRRSPSTLDSLSSYQVLVIPVDGMVTFDCSAPASSEPPEYIAAQLHLRHVGTEMNFTVGDGRLYGGFYNAPLERSKNYYIILRAVCQWKTALKCSCVLWAKVRGTSYILRVSSLCAAAFVALATLLVLGGYAFIWCVKKT